MPKWRLIISGRVQTAGYRAIVKNIAIGMKVKGMVRNLDDGSVEIYCETTPEIFDKFKKAIDVKSEPRNIFAPSVESIVVYDEEKPEYGTAPSKEYKGFKIDYTGVDSQAETLERSEMGIVALGAVSSNIISMHTDLKDETRKTHEELGGMNNKLDNISNQLGDALNRYDKIGNKMTSMESDMKELTKQITRLVNHMVSDENKSL